MKKQQFFPPKKKINVSTKKNLQLSGLFILLKLSFKISKNKYFYKY